MHGSQMTWSSCETAVPIASSFNYGFVTIFIQFRYKYLGSQVAGKRS